MKQLICVFTLLMSTLSTAYTGSLEVQRYFNSHFPSYTDRKGEQVSYGILLDNEFSLWKFPQKSFWPSANLSFGIEGFASTVFDHGGGNAGLELSWPKLDIGLEHKSIHNFDSSQGKFLNQNYLRVKYKWGDGI